MNKWLGLEMDGNSDFSVSYGSSHFHVLENATGLITISCLPWWKELVFLLFELFPPLTCPSPELGTQRPSNLVGVRAVAVTQSTESSIRLQHSTFHMARPGTSQLCWLSPGY